MSATTLSAPRSTGGALRRFRLMTSALTDWNDARITRKALSRLTARELDDIGLTRFDIETVARRGGLR